jgi:S1-C subfamily serine protease
VAQVLNETPAAVIGIQRGDRITAVNDTPVKDIAAFYKTLREKTDKELWFTFVRGDSTLESLKVKR